MDRRAFEWERVLERRLGVRERGGRRRRRAPDASREGERSQGAQTRRRHRRTQVSGGHRRSVCWLQSSLRTDGAGGHARHRMRAFLSRGLHLVANSVSPSISTSTSTHRTSSRSNFERQPDAPASELQADPHFANSLSTLQDSVKVRVDAVTVASAPTLVVTTTAPLPERAQTDLPLVPASDGQRPQDPPHVLQGKAVPQAHSPQGHPVQDGQGLAFRSGKASLRQEAVRCVTPTTTQMTGRDGAAADCKGGVCV